MQPDEASTQRTADGPAGASSGRSRERGGSSLDVALKGALPCVRCGYELQGLSVRGSCPECGTAIRATILFTVDPHAEALQPLVRPTLVSLGLTLWSTAAFAAALASWTPRGAELATLAGLSPPAALLRVSHWIAIAAMALSALGALVSLVRPARRMPLSRSAVAAAGVALYGPLILLFWRLRFEIDAAAPTPYLDAAIDVERLVHRLAIALCIAGAIVALRPNARALAARSLVLRTGRVDRQTMYATLAAVAMTAAGDGLRLAAWGLGRGPIQQSVDALGVLLVVVGSLLITLALAGIVVDSLRIARALRTPAPSLRSLLHGA